jgi:hypothetical protein
VVSTPPKTSQPSNATHGVELGVISVQVEIQSQVRCPGCHVISDVLHGCACQLRIPAKHPFRSLWLLSLS